MKKIHLLHNVKLGKREYDLEVIENDEKVNINYAENSNTLKSVKNIINFERKHIETILNRIWK